MNKVWILAVALAGCGTVLAQESNPTATEHWPQQGQQPQGTENGVPIYKITVVGRDIPAINYFHRSGSTPVGLRGTDLLPGAKGRAEVNSLNGRTQLKVHVESLVPANSFGIEYLTYVLWAITPEGRPVNLGELLWSHSGKADTTVTTNLQSFGLIVTAEPYFAVTMPSDVVVMQNFVMNDKTSGVLETVNAHYNLLPRGAYAQTEGRHSVLHPITRNDRSPLELYEAINAVQIADAEGAEKYAPDSMASAKQDLDNAQQMDIHQKEMKQEITYAREAVQTSEDARILTIRKKQAEEQAAQRASEEAAKKQAQVSALAAEEAKQRQQEAQNQAQAAQAQQQQAEAAAETARAEQAKAQAAQQAAEQAEAQARQASEQMREKLREQLNQVLNTQETARGLIVNMSDVLFGFNKFDLKTDAQIKLAKVSGILLTYPNLKVQVEGYTDNVGSAEYNQQLSEKRAMAVQSFLISQGVAPGNMTAQGFGPADPVADNSSSSGRAQNRRVEMVVSGQSIGLQEQAPTPANSQPVPPGTAPITAQPPVTNPQGTPPPTPQANPQPQPQPHNPTGVSQGPPQ
ncbi:MAG TPA: OmpA family protein [Acidobacteriaceae bacterium]|jgi:outer membrane protein OmpA-like peptidoglycan-associated protein|nr:OmpA family protein [Acidobacteriaceae bacterium]